MNLPVFKVGMIGVAAITCVTSMARADGEIKDEWFFEGANRPAALRALEGKPAPELTTQAWIGDATSIEANRGKVVVIDFWATWCGPCMAAIPENVELVKKLAGKPFAFIGVHDANSGWNKAPDAVKSKHINYPVAQDKGDSAKAYQLSFWPTYIVIDHEGIVRAAGLIPSHVAEVVEILLAKVPAGAAGGDATATLLGGAARPAWLKQVEGAAIPALHPEGKWVGTPITDDAMRNQVVVMEFFSPTGNVGVSQLAELSALTSEFAPQGVVFLGVCDSRVPWAQAKPLIEAKKVSVPVVQDLAVPGVAGREGSIRSGAMAASLGVRLAPTIVVFDRTGKARAVGVRPNKVKDLINTMLAEPSSPAQPVATTNPTSN